MEYLQNGFSLEVSPEAFPLSTDSIVLSDFIRLPRNAKVLDLGAGCGTLGLLLCAKDPTCAVTGVEIDENVHNIALQNIAANQVSSRLSSICADLRTVPSLFASGSFHCCISNPPYFSSKQESANSKARHEQLCDLNDLFTAAQWAVQFGGDFFVVHKPERLAELCACAAAHKLEPKRLQLLRHKADGPISLILLQCRKGAKPGLTIEEKFLHNNDGTPSEYYRRLYHI